MNPFLEMAFAEAQLAAERGEVPVGAVLARNGIAIARDGNRVEEMADPTAHAEMLVIRRGAAQLGVRLDECDLYVTLEPCPMCAAALSLARVRKLVFAAYDPKGGGVEHGARVFDRATCHHKPEIVGGLEEERAAQILRAFFRDRR